MMGTQSRRVAGMGQEVSKDRQHVRASVALTARFVGTSETRQYEGVCQNLSRSGMFLGTPRPAPVGARLRIDCELVDGSGRIRGVVRVMWVRHEAAGSGRPAGMGLRFLNLEPGSEALIDDVLARGDIGTSGRRARSDPPEQRPDSQRPKLVAVATIREVHTPDTSAKAKPHKSLTKTLIATPRPPVPPKAPDPSAVPDASTKTISSSPPPGRSSRDAGELRERWKTLRQTRREFPAGVEQPTSSAPPPAPSPCVPEESGSQLLPPPTSAERESRATEPEGTTRVTEPGDPGFGPNEPPDRPMPDESDESDESDERDLLDDPEWRARRLADLVEMEAKTQRAPGPEHSSALVPRLSVEEAVLVRGPTLQLSGARGVRVAVGLLIIGGAMAFAFSRRGPSVPAEPAAIAPQVAQAAASTPPMTVPALQHPPAVPLGAVVPPTVSAPAQHPAAVGAAPAQSSGSSRSPSAPSKTPNRSRASSERSSERSSAREVPPAPAPEPAQAREPVLRVAPGAADGATSQLQVALDCLKVGDSACAVKALEGKARSERELELLVESYRAIGNNSAAEERMRIYLQRFPAGSMIKTYRRLLQYRHPLDAVGAPGGALGPAPAAPWPEDEGFPRVAPPPATPTPSAP